MNPADMNWRRIATLTVAAGLVVVFAAVLVASVPQVVGADHSFVVLSDSMSPTINAGSVVVVSEVQSDRIEKGDVITYVDSRSADGTTRITHRVVDIEMVDGQQQFRTQGDANESPDPRPVPSTAVIGVVGFHIPLVGYLIEFAGSTTGLITLIVVPAILLAVSEAWSLYSDHEASNGEDG
ncbi:signal peptidase I [Halorhabdus rudnickae]|uniref:signal peptidase I n=1 Tax=Halorhabdus rudnickae TaxID=1775544 RepID=UPI0010825483|nr:signal peptidase I [Halorhabdus rudnickae]